MKKEKILLLLLPFWDPQIPPPGLACLKSYLQQHGYPVKAVDTNIDDSLKETYHLYFNRLREIVPKDRQGNFNKIGFDVFHNHLMAYMHRDNDETFIEALQSVVRTTFFVEFQPEHIWELDDFVKQFFQRLEAYILQVLAEETPDVLGITVYTDTLPATLLAFRLAKENYPDIRIVMGGGIFASDMAVDTPNMDYFLEKAGPYVEKIIVGEGEQLFLKYLQNQLPPDKKIVTLKDIDNKILTVEDATLPDFSDFDLVHYPYLATYTSRSCPFQCEFCTETQMWGKFRKKSADKVAGELLELYRKHGNQLFFMSDSLLNPVVTDLSRRLLQEETSIYWDGYLRAHRDACNTENTMLWRRGGFYRARLGLESGSQRVLDLMNKRITLKEIRETVAALAYAGIKTTTYWLLGFPGETEEDFQQTLDLIEEMADDIYEVNCSPFWYFQSAQGGEGIWKDKIKALYPEFARKMFVLQTWIVDCVPNREEIYRRMWRFTEHCNKLGLTSPYSLKEFHEADLRWVELHKNAVPPMVWFGNKDHYIDENKKIEELVTAHTVEADDGDFGF